MERQTLGQAEQEAVGRVCSAFLAVGYQDVRCAHATLNQLCDLAGLEPIAQALSPETAWRLQQMVWNYEALPTVLLREVGWLVERLRYNNSHDTLRTPVRDCRLSEVC